MDGERRDYSLFLVPNILTVWSYLLLETKEKRGMYDPAKSIHKL